MEQKIKFLLIGVSGIALVFLFLFAQAFVSKQAIQREREELRKENATLNSKTEKLEASIRDYENKFNTAKKDLDAAVQQKVDLEKKLNQAIKEREDLQGKLKESPVPVVMQQAAPVPENTDEYWANILKQKASLGLQLEDLRKGLNDIQLNNRQLQKDKSALELEITNYKRERSELLQRSDYNQKMIDSVTRDFVRERNDKTKLQESYKTLRQENITLIRQLNSLNNRKLTLDRKMQKLQTERDELGRRVDEMETMLTDKVNNVSDFKDQIDAIRQGKAVKKEAQSAENKEQVELPPIVVRPSASTSNPASLSAFEGKIVSINKENNFVIVDLGERAGLKAGDTLQAYHGDKAVANLEVIQTRNDISACNIKEEFQPLQMGDAVR